MDPIYVVKHRIFCRGIFRGGIKRENAPSLGPGDRTKGRSGLSEFALADVVNLGSFDAVEQHHCDDGERTLLGNFAGFVEAEFARFHSREVDPSGEPEGCRFIAKACQPVDPFVLKTAVPIARGVM